MPTAGEIAAASAEMIAEKKLAAIRAEIALVSGVVQALATSMHATHALDLCYVGGVENEWSKSEERLVHLLAQEREMMEGK
jgi:hypothetical protein